MLQYMCDWCKRVKQSGEAWILGFAAETVGITAAKREVTLASHWDANRAAHPLAVHFCSEEHKDDYVAALFDFPPVATETVLETTVKVSPKKKVVRSEKRVVRTKSYRRGVRRRVARSAAP